jgi:hypothetical protein
MLKDWFRNSWEWLKIHTTTIPKTEWGILKKNFGVLYMNSVSKFIFYKFYNQNLYLVDVAIDICDKNYWPNSVQTMLNLAWKYDPN